MENESRYLISEHQCTDTFNVLVRFGVRYTYVQRLFVWLTVDLYRCPIVTGVYSEDGNLYNQS